MKKYLAFLIIILLLALSSCGGEIAAGTGAGEISVYRLIRLEYRTGTQLVRAEKISYSDDSNVIQGAAYALKSIPDNPELSSALPANVSILSAELSGRTVDICMSDSYLKLSGIEKTIADSCIALTMCSIQGVDYVSIHTTGNTARLRLSSEDILLRNTLVGDGTASIRLYFPKDGNGVLAAEYRSVEISDDTSAERIVIDELLKGPASEGLSPALPEDTVVLPVYTQDGVCTVSFSEDFLNGLAGDPDAIRLAVYSVVNSLTCLADVDSVLIVVQNNADNLIGNIDISEPLTRKTSLIGSAVIE